MIAAAPLVIGPHARTRLHALRDNATFRPVDVLRLSETIATEHGKSAHRRQMIEQTVMLPGIWNFFVTYSIETGHPAGTCRHMSVSIDREGRVPNPEAVWMIATEMGFTRDLRACVVWIEDLEQGRAVNVVQPLGPDEQIETLDLLLLPSATETPQ